MTGRVKQQQHIEWLATHDPLTGAVNRSGLFHALSDVGPQASLTLFYLDLDGFKNI